MGKGKPTLAKKTSTGNGKTRSPLSVSSIKGWEWESESESESESERRINKKN